MLSLNSLRTVFHNSKLGVVLLSIVTVAMLVTAYTGIGAILGRSNSHQSASAASRSPDSVVATVNGESITRADFNQAYAMMQQRSQMMGQSQQGPSAAAQIRTQALDELIGEVEGTQTAAKLGVAVSDADVAKARDTQLGQIRTQLSLKPNATVDEINASLASNGSSATVDELVPLSTVRRQAIDQKMQQLTTNTPPANDQQVQNYYRQVHTRHILISNKTKPDAQAKALAEDLTKRINAGGDFVALAKQYSDDTGSKDKGGDDGFIDSSTHYVPEFLKAAMALKKGQLTPEPVLSPQYGYFIIQAVDERENLPKDYAKNKAKYAKQVSQTLLMNGERDAYQSVSANAVVVVKDPLLRAERAATGPPQPGAPTPDNKAILADLQTALNGASYNDKGEIYAQMAQVYLQQKDYKNEIASLKSALDQTEDSQLRMQLGDAYQKTGDIKDAIDQYQQASGHAFDNPMIHIQLQTAFKQLKRQDLADKEAAWMKNYEQQQKQARAGQTPPGTMPINLPPSH